MIESVCVTSGNWKDGLYIIRPIESYLCEAEFSGISRDIYHDTQPFFFIEKTGISGLTFKPFAKLRLASSGTRLYVDISDVLKPLSKNARRKAVRYAKSDNALRNEIYSLCSTAVKKYI